MVVVGMMLSKAIRARGCSSCCRAKVKAGFPPAWPGVRPFCDLCGSAQRVQDDVESFQTLRRPKSTWRRTTSRHLTIVTTTATNWTAS